jgi:hypothetical protein
MFDIAPLLEEPFAQTLSGNTVVNKILEFPDNISPPEPPQPNTLAFG